MSGRLLGHDVSAHARGILTGTDVDVSTVVGPCLTDVSVGNFIVNAFYTIRTLCRRSSFSIFVMLAVISAIQLPADALTQTGSIGDLDFSIYGPDWTWQKRDINILVVLENGGGKAANVNLNLVFPPGKEDHFRYDGEVAAELSVPAGKTVRHVFTNILALDGVPRQLYDFQLVVGSEGREVRIAYPVRTIRGAVVSPGRWALFLPGGAALAWCIVFAAVVRRFAEPGAWRVPGKPVHEPDKSESWMEEEAT